MKCKVFVAFLSFVFLCSGFAGETFFSSAYAQDKKIVSKKQTSQKPAKKWRIVTLGEHGQFKGADGFQMALNMAQDMDEIRIEKGTIEASGLVIPENKEWANGIKISGGWNETFTEKSNNPEDTALVGNSNENDKRIITISNKKGSVFIENITFSNNNGGAIRGNVILFTCVFTNNSSASVYGGAIYGNGHFTNCTFSNNSAGYGGAVCGDGYFTNCTFSNNSGSDGGAVNGAGTFKNCTFNNNSAYRSAGAVHGDGTFTNCTFSNNSITEFGNAGAVYGNGHFISCIFSNNSAVNDAGAVYGNASFTNCTFSNNSANSEAGAVYGISSFTNCIFSNNSAGSSGGILSCDIYGGNSSFTNCIFINNTSAKNGGVSNVTWNSTITFSNCTFFGNKATESGGAIFGNGTVINCIFYKNIASEQDNDINVNGKFKIDYSLFNNLTGGADIGPNNIIGDPKFIDSDNGDFSLASDSPCINKGTVLVSKNAGKSQPKSKSGIAKKRINMGANLDFKMIKDLFNTQSE